MGWSSTRVGTYATGYQALRRGGTTPNPGALRLLLCRRSEIREGAVSPQRRLFASFSLSVSSNGNGRMERNIK